jgi:hypothetical protein
MNRNPFSTDFLLRQFLADSVRQTRSDLRENGKSARRTNVAYAMGLQMLKEQSAFRGVNSEAAEFARLGRKYASYLLHS